jgi:hypothetical protein
MSTQNVTPQPASPPPSLPDVNAQITPYDVVQSMLDETANFSMFSVPIPRHNESATITPQTPGDWFGLDGGYGLDLLGELRRFESTVDASSGTRVKVSQTVGQDTGTFHCLCLFSPPDSKWNTKQTPPPWIFDPWRSQRFAMQECELTFGQRHTCQFYGVGRTFPINVGGRHVLLVGGVANLAKGTGRFEGREGTLIMSGTLTQELGFLGNINVRVRDHERTLVADDELNGLTGISTPGSENTFIELRLIKKDKNVKTSFGPPPGDGRVSLITPSIMRSVQYSYMTGMRGPRSQMSVGQALGPMQATVFFDLTAPPGTADAPVPFSTDELYTFNDGSGATLGTISCNVVEGQSWGLKFPAAPKQPGVRFAGFGPIRGGTGVFAGVQGLLTVNSLIGISPHTLSLMHALMLVDPEGKFRVGAR